MPTFFRVLLHTLIIAALATGLFIFREWAYVATYRLYLDDRVDDTSASTARQRFDVDGDRVVPRIVMRDDSVSFHAAVDRDATILATVTAAGTGSYEIRVRQGGTDRVAAKGLVTGPTSIVCPLPTGNGVVEVLSRGELTWTDLRLQRDLQISGALWLLAGLLAATVLCALVVRATRPPPPVWAVPTRASAVWPGVVTVLASVVVGILAMEGVLRAVGTRLSNGISTARHDLGELTDDPRWQHSPRYGQRLNANVNAVNQWRHGDIVRMGFIPPDVSEGRVRQFPMRTDAEGFRNQAPRDDIEVAALGDSFTDALTMPLEATWTSQLERLLGRPVQNYGTAGFGPQQELLVLEDFAVRHRPRVVVLAFFAGNDIRDAEAFERFQKNGGKAEPPKIGWPIKDVYTRADTWYVVNALKAAAAATSPGPPDKDALLRAKPSVASGSPRFDRGMFTVPVKESTLRWAFMPPYLEALKFSEQEWSARLGWALARQSLTAMQRVSRDVDAQFIVLFLPSKSQVYLPLLERTFSRDELVAPFQFYLGQTVSARDIATMSKNRLALNNLMKRFCSESGIPFLDMTEDLQDRVEAGEGMYFSDDSHINEAGALVIASSLAEFLQSRALVGRVVSR